MKKKINLITFHLSEKNIYFKKKMNSRNNYLIGDWCRINKEKFDKNSYSYSQNNSDNNIKWLLGDAKVLGLKKNYYFKIDSQDAKFILLKYKNLVNLLSKKLNQIHNKNYNTIYWKFFLHRWLMLYIVTTYFHWKTANLFLKNFKIKSLYNLNLDNKIFIPDSTLHFRKISLMHNGYWSHWTFVKIFKFRLKNIRDIGIKLKKKINFNKKLNEYAKIFKSKVLNISFKKRIFFSDLSFDRKIIYDLFIKYKFFNNHYAYKEIIINSDESQKHIRKKFFKNLKKNDCKFENFLVEHMQYCLPKIYLENYKSLDNEYKNLNWPKNPEFILSTYAHYNDEMFKIYCANKINKNSKFFIAQHGEAGIYANNDFFNIGWDKLICNKFLSWGKLKKQKHKKFFYTKKYFKNNNKFLFSNNNKILFVSHTFQETIVRYYNGVTAAEVNQTSFKNILSLSSSINQNIIYEPHLRSSDLTENKTFKKEIKRIIPKLKFLDIKKNYLDIINNYNLIIHFFLSTPFFESVLHNTPTILIFEKKIHLNFNKNFNKMIKKLHKQKIFFSSTEKATKFINDNNGNLEKWWNSKSVQNLRAEICNDYCRNYDPKTSLHDHVFN